MEKKLVSVIVPIYNVEDYIEKCVESLITQDYENIEIILVDDGSPDNSGSIIDRIKGRDERIKVLHKENGGVSSARNAGIKEAKGEYITFVDGDDWVEPDYVTYFVELLDSNECEIGMNINNYSEAKKTKKNESYVVSSEKAIEWIYLGKIFVAVWNKIYRTEFLKKNDILFDESIWYGEGMLFNIDCLQYTERVAIGEKGLYHQVLNPNSAMRKFNLKSNHCGIRSLEVQKEHWKKKNKRIDAAWDYHLRAFNWSIMGGLARSDMETEYREEYDKCAKNLKKELWKTLRVPISLKEKLLYTCLAISPYLMAKRAKRKARQRKRQITRRN